MYAHISRVRFIFGSDFARICPFPKEESFYSRGGGGEGEEKANILPPALYLVPICERKYKN